MCVCVCVCVFIDMCVYLRAVLASCVCVCASVHTGMCVCAPGVSRCCVVVLRVMSVGGRALCRCSIFIDVALTRGAALGVEPLPQGLLWCGERERHAACIVNVWAVEPPGPRGALILPLRVLLSPV